MTGIIEDEDPGKSGLSAYTVTSSARADVPALDVELLIDRLRFLGLDAGLVDEADRRLRADPPVGMRWLEERLKDHQPPRKPPTCGDCGEPLVDAAWRGRATVRCRICGSRSGVEVIDETTESMWAISGPTAEWQEAHPVEACDPYGDLEPDKVLRYGLPPLPATIEPGTYFPVATWQGDRDAAVLYVHRLAPEDFDPPGGEYEDETEHLILDEDGQWTSTNSGGGSWVNVFSPPANLLEKYVVLGTGISGSGDGNDAVSCTGGLCSSAVAAVETTDSQGTRTYPILSERPFFVVGVRGPGQVRILDEHGRVLRSAKDKPLEFRLNG